MVSSSPLSPFFAFFNFFLMFLFRFFMFYFMFKCESPPNSVAYDWWRRQSYATLLDWTMGSGGFFCCVPLLALVCLGSGGWPMFRCVPLLASGTQPIVCRYWHRVVWDLGVGLCSAVCCYWHQRLKFWDLGALFLLCAVIGIVMCRCWPCKITVSLVFNLNL